MHGSDIGSIRKRLDARGGKISNAEGAASWPPPSDLAGRIV
jgi:hypothetical protein